MEVNGGITDVRVILHDFVCSTAKETRTRSSSQPCEGANGYIESQAVNHGPGESVCS